MYLTVAAEPLVALIAGILILIIPRLLNYVVAIYLIIIGLLGLFHPPAMHRTVEAPALLLPVPAATSRQPLSSAPPCLEQEKAG
jgi:hypothetical protein